MRLPASLFVVAFACAAGACMPAGGPPPGASSSESRPSVDAKWADDVGDVPFVVGLDAGTKAVAASGRPPMYYFTTTWCGYCKQLAATGFRDADFVAKVKANFTPILLDGDDPANAELAGKYGVEGFPTVVFADAAGNAKASSVGADVGKLKTALARAAR